MTPANLGYDCLSVCLSVYSSNLSIYLCNQIRSDQIKSDLISSNLFSVCMSVCLSVYLSKKPRLR